jgi:rubredoxin
VVDVAEYVVEEPSDRSPYWQVHERIVRCRDCKRAFEHDFGHLYCGRRPGSCFEVCGDDFCSRGVPKEVDA